MRRHCLWLAVVVIHALGGTPLQAAAAGPVVAIASGTLRGVQHGNLAVFLGVPFAAPPVGDLRWREPQPVAAWSGIREASAPSRPCMQNLAGVDNFMVPLAATYGVTVTRQALDPSEDCLYLNVWMPKLQNGTLLPVMVWLHGGSNRVGSGSEPGYDGSVLAAHGVVVVTINYRLGAMGFFAHPELTAESPHHSSGNYGLLDQIAALKWVQQNIKAFGGDAGNVTLFGESAGSVDATTLMASALTSGLFRRVIAESGGAFGLGRERSVAQMEPLGQAVGKEALGGKPGSQLRALRSMPATQVTAIEDRLIATQFKGYDPNASIVDGWVLWESPAKAFASGKIQPVELLAGVNAREFSAFRVFAADAAKNAHVAIPKPRFSEQLKQFSDLARPLYGSWTNLAVATYTARIMMHGTSAVDQASNDILGACPAGAEAALTTRAGQRAYVYRFERSVPGKGEAELGAFHSLELPYVFGTFQVRTFNWLPFNQTDHKLAEVMQNYWTNFAKTGDPNGPGLPQWTPWNADKEPFLIFSENGDAVPEKNFSPVYCHLAADRLSQQLANY